MSTTHRHPRLRWSFLRLGLAFVLGTAASPAVAQSDCVEVYSSGDGWAIDACETAPEIASPMDIVLDGVAQGQAAVIRVYHQSEGSPGVPQVAVLYASGFVRLKQNADPVPALPFGSSFVLGPAYWSDASTYHHNPTLSRLEIDTRRLPAALLMTAEGQNEDFDVQYELTLPAPRDRQTRLHVVQRCTASSDVSIDPTRRAERQGFKSVQVSSMFINVGGTCDGGFSDCHDSDGVRFVGSDLTTRERVFSDVVASGFVLDSPPALGNVWLDVLHRDDASWHSQTGGTSGNTPNVRVVLDELPSDRTITPQGWIEATTNPNDDNVGVWLHDDGPASASWTEGQTQTLGYWLVAQDGPAEPWQDLGLRTGLTFQDFEGSYDCFPVLPADRPVSGTVSEVAGPTGAALRLTYDLTTGSGNWAQVRCNFDPPLDLSSFDHLRFDWWGDSANSLEVGVVTPRVGGEDIFGRGFHHATHHAWPARMTLPFAFLHPWSAGTTFDPSAVSALFFSVVLDPADDVGGTGHLTLDNLNAVALEPRATPGGFEEVAPAEASAREAAAWIAAQQQPTGLLKSWPEEATCIAHTYDQALGLIALAHDGRWTQANAVARALATTQNPDGSWYKSRDCLTRVAVDSNKWEGDIAWAVYALGRYLTLGGHEASARAAAQRGAAWLAAKIRVSGDGCLVTNPPFHTEATIDAWWALQSVSTPAARTAANAVRGCLLATFWDETMGRFKGGNDWWQPYLDNQTWGGAFLKAIGEDERARRALSYARAALTLPAQGSAHYGLDGQAGPWSLWNEGVGQYAAVGGEGANDMLRELTAQQEHDGALRGSPDFFSGGGVWTTRWHGIAPTAWLYFALSGEPFLPSPTASTTPPSVPVPRTPAAGALITVDAPTLDWADSTPSVDHYQVHLAADAAFASLVLDVTTTASSLLVDPPLAPNTRYYWAVRAVNAAGQWSAWSVARSFRQAMTAPGLLDPPLHAQVPSLRPPFDWSDVGGATSYTLQISPSPTFSPLTLGATATSSSYEPTASLPVDRTLFWRVRANGPNGPSLWSEVWDFLTPSPPGVPVLLAPADLALVLDGLPTLDWRDSVPNLDHYAVQIATDSAFTVAVRDVDVVDSAYTPPVALSPNVLYYWRVRAFNAAGHYSLWSAVRRLRSAMLPPIPTCPPVVYTTRPTLDWEDVAGSTSYTCQLSTSPSYVPLLASLTVPVSECTPRADLPRARTIHWRVRANGPNGPSGWSDTCSFPSANPPGVPVQLAPANAALTSDFTPRLDWSDSAPGLDHYRLQVATDSAFSALVYDVDIPTSGFTPPAPLQANTLYYWRVRAFNAAGEYSLWSVTRSFRTATLPAQLVFASLPPEGSLANLGGRLTRLAVAGRRVAVFIEVDGLWRRKPSATGPLTALRSDGTWTCDITTEPGDERARRVAAYVVPSTFVVPALTGAPSLPLEIDENALASVIAHRGGEALVTGFESACDDWTMFEEIVGGSSCYGVSLGEVACDSGDAYEGSGSLQVWANRTASTLSNHVLAQNKVATAGREGRWEYSVYFKIDGGTPEGQTGPEISMQNTRETTTPQQFRTTIAGIQYQGNPYLPEPGRWALWQEVAPGQATWVPFYTQALEAGQWYLLSLEADFSANRYVRLHLRGGAVTPVDEVIDLTAHPIAQESRFGEEAFWITAEAENLWNNCGTAGSTEFKIRYDNASLRRPSRAGFVYPGITHVSWWHNEYASAAATPSRVDLASTKAGWAGVLTTWYMDRATSNDIEPSWPTSPGCLVDPSDDVECRKTPTDAALTQAIRHFHDLGLRVMLKPTVDVQDGTWRANIDPGSSTEWFESYRAFIAHYAALAAESHVDMFSIGTELASMSSSYLPEWTSLIEATRATFEALPAPARPVLSYGANATAPGEEYASVAFWHLLDIPGLDVYPALTDKLDPTVQELVDAWRNNRYGQDMVAAFENWQASHGKPVVFAEIGYRSVDGACTAPWDTTLAGAPDPQEQADCYEAAFRVWSQETSWMHGMFWWNWPVPAPAAGDTDYTPRNKPAEEVLRWWYSPWAPDEGAGSPALTSRTR